ncbi:putative selenate ABC transporter substrate-binding protein [Streptomyces boncukensis]|uniref:Putative selenate ABC transporter substrate-binding protein n=1 Tax=Streptomyces boncukensis TaxID=2711219 RepID=A0A6G4XAW9_9ACTN|nr:putative selenate ABC transporter substrate-binding protein [Streptomyces boncukensis]NGO73801.1 putative selenate ABC transporter substrate-binding protein [Streptomyces boncukensis]
MPAISLPRRALLLGPAAALLSSACGSAGGAGADRRELGISAIPDQDPELLNRLYPAVAERFADATGLRVRYRPVTDYTAVVRAFEVGDIHLAWMGGLTGVQARKRVPGAAAFAQRDIDAGFRSLFIAHTRSGLRPFERVGGLRELAGHTLTFGSETSTSGRLMPEYFMRQAGLRTRDLKGKPGFSGSHDATIEAVAGGSFEAGAVNQQVWEATSRKDPAAVRSVRVLWRTPGYADYHWLARPDLDDTFGSGTRGKVRKLLLGLDSRDAEDAEVLKLFGAESFVSTRDSAYDRIEDVARDLGLLA